MLNQNKVGVALGGFLALFHAVWSLLVALGFAQALLDFVFMIHMMVNPVTVKEFNFGLTVGLVILTAVVGYVFGWVFAWLYNQAHR